MYQRKKKDRGKKLEKVYFAPAFSKKESFAISEDSMQIAIQAVYFDICELAARWARKKLYSLQDSLKAYGTLYIMYATIEAEMQKARSEMWQSYTSEVIDQKKPGAYESWRKFYDDMLNQTNQWATKPEECYRLLSGQPIEDGYEKSETIMPAMTKTIR